MAFEPRSALSPLTPALGDGSCTQGTSSQGSSSRIGGCSLTSDNQDVSVAQSSAPFCRSSIPDRHTTKTRSPFPHLAPTCRAGAVLQEVKDMGALAGHTPSSLGDQRLNGGRSNLRRLGGRVHTSSSQDPLIEQGSHSGDRGSVAQLQCRTGGVLPSGRGRP